MEENLGWAPREDLASTPPRTAQAALGARRRSHHSLQVKSRSPFWAYVTLPSPTSPLTYLFQLLPPSLSPTPTLLLPPRKPPPPRTLRSLLPGSSLLTPRRDHRRNRRRNGVVSALLTLQSACSRLSPSLSSFLSLNT